MGINASEWLLGAILILFFFLTGKGFLGFGENSLKGHWVSDDGNRMSFDGIGEVSINFDTYEYTLLYDNKVTITGKDVTFLYSYEVEKDVLTLKDAYSEITHVYHRDKNREEF
ncbi:hypothetical protein [Papillibacter cinnamivorans]|uniref:DUF5640 domain-containing protein n=1 Tax=Papillibacter cinnamivorans DSM 12816 TaxID=1122930 RepID=A0A1W2CKK3_9FIRM|nr:hypothetical protein [Papillibacter cinnamivorans]SMC85759.1 hypothetical protein SAMN02745168_0072 [Papillibacter cinnamivorans DSM 12816]